MEFQSGMIRRHSNTVGALSIALDAVVVAGSLSLIYWLRGIWGQRLPWYYIAGTTAVMAFYLSGRTMGLYRAWRGATLREEYATIARAWALAVCMLLLGSYATKTSELYSRIVVLGWFTLTPLVLCLSRWATRSVLWRLRQSGHNTRTAAVVGYGEMAARLCRHIHASPELGLRFKGIYADDAAKGDRPMEGLDVSVEGSIEQLLELAHSGDLDHIYVALPMDQKERIADIVDRLADSTVNLHIVPDFFMSELMHRRWSTMGDIPLIRVYDTPFYGADGIIKRLEDVLLGSVLLAVAALPMLLVAITVRLTSPGPVLFRQRRYGIDGTQITVWKFRTMSVCEDGEAVEQAQKDDARVTPLGGFLRRTSLDELPQLINVLEGRMSLVGPRPHAVAHNEQYRKLIKGYMLRHKVKPGITGWAQVNGLRGETRTVERMQERVRFDLDYIDNWSLLFDIRILLKTVSICLVQKNAY